MNRNSENPTPEAADQGRLLVVDDEVEIREMLRRHFRFLGYQVETANDGKEALEKLNQSRFDLVITDLMMPGMDGMELLREMRSQFPMVRSVVITGHVRMNNLLAAIRYGAENCVFKPLSDLSELEETVQESVRRLRRWQTKLHLLAGMEQA